MIFAKYYNATNVAKEMVTNKEIMGYPYNGNTNFGFEGVYVCMDVTDFWICRIIKGVDEDYEESDGYLVERNRFSIYQVLDKLEEMYNVNLSKHLNYKNEHQMKNQVHNYFKEIDAKSIIKAVILLDDDDGLSNWDSCEADSLEDAIEIIDDGFGIVEDF